MTNPGLSAAAREIGVELDPQQCKQLERFVAALEKWNAKFNLLSRTDIQRVWPRHVLDSLSLVPLLPQRPAPRSLRLLDLGSGGGFPGLPMAIAAPQLEVVLLDRNARKVRFLDNVVAELALPNVLTRCSEAAELIDVEPVDVLVSRAVAAPLKLWELGARLLRDDGVMLLQTGVGHDGTVGRDGVEQGERAFVIDAVHKIPIPGLDRVHEVTIMRHLVR